MTQQATDVVILGGTGFIGQCLKNRLRLQDRPRTTGDARAPDFPSQVSSLSSGDCDLLDLQQTRDQLKIVTSATTLIVCSGISRLAGDSWSLFETNLMMVRNLCQALDAREPRSIVFLSSTDVYGLPVPELPITENTLPHPTTYYGLAKLACENIFRLKPGPSCPVTSLRLPGIYGPTDAGRSVVGVFCDRLAARQPVQLSAAGRTARDFVHVDDLCSLIEALIASPLHTTLNVATGRSLAVADVARCVAQELQLPPHVANDLLKSAPATIRDHDLVFDPRHLRASFPDVSFRTVAEGIRAYIEDLPQDN